ncbi:MAG: hypothetical protein HN991_00660 [Candidatus Jacksonbacteria bacterium]|nr:hypothetical protein [Candidatus Jacksonbacteria bacterium]
MAEHRGFIGIIIAIFLVVISSYFMATKKLAEEKNSEPAGDDIVFCTQDAKECWDGSYVARVSPDCSFSACPGVTTENDFIKISSPVENQEVGFPLTIRGEARTFESTVNIRILNSDKTILYENFTTARSAQVGVFGPFETTLSYPEPKSSTGFIELFEYSAKDGTETSRLLIPIRFTETNTTTIKAFFNNISHDPNLIDCNVVYPVERRTASADTIEKAALQELLLGPSILERTSGFQTQIPERVEINSLEVEDGTAYVDLSEELEPGGGSCIVTAIVSQINQTLTQFSHIEAVELSIKGETESILQP